MLIHQYPHPLPYLTTIVKLTIQVRSFSTAGENFFLSCDPYGPNTTVSINITGVHPTLGLQIDSNTTSGRLVLLNCLKGTPSAKIKRWRSTLRNGNILEMDGEIVSTIKKIEEIIAEARRQQKSEIKITIATEERVPIHNDSGTPQLYFDQSNAIPAYLQEIKYEEEF